MLYLLESIPVVANMRKTPALVRVPIEAELGHYLHHRRIRKPRLAHATAVTPHISSLVVDYDLGFTSLAIV